jgi:hypothetical protein
VQSNDAERQRRLNQLTGEFIARARSAGFTVEELMAQLLEFQTDAGKKRR